MFRKQQEESRLITASFAGIGLYANEGEIIVVPAGATMPQSLKANSETYTGHVPHNARRFDPVEYEKANQPRPEPPAPRELTEPDIERRFGWYDGQLATANQCGFPVRAGWRGEESFWLEPAVLAWEERIRSLGIGR